MNPISAMDAANLLGSLKNKVLDVKNFEVLNAAFQWQEKTNQQLRSNNEALTESNGLLKEQLASLEERNAAVEAKVHTLEAQIAAIPKPSVYAPLGLVYEVLMYYRQKDTTELSDESFHSLSPSSIAIRDAIEELRANGFIMPTRITRNGIFYELTAEGRKVVLS